MPVGQVSNQQMKDILDSEFQRSNDPSFLSRIAISKYLNMPGLRGFWTSTYRNDTAYAGSPYLQDISGGGYHLAPGGGQPRLNIDLGHGSQYFDGTTYFTLADNTQFDILANEAWVQAPGISLGAWIYTERAQPYANNEGIISKWNTAGNQRAYLLMLDANNPVANGLTFYLSSDGANGYAFDHSKTVSRSTWYFAAVTYNPGAYMNEPAGVRLWVNDVMQYHAAADRGTAGLPASIFDSNQAFQFASYAGAANLFLGSQAYWWICGNYLLEGEIYNLYETTKHLFPFENEKGTAW